MSAHASHATPLGGRMITRSTVLMALLTSIMGVLLFIRLFTGLGSVSAISNGYPWGIWKPVNVVTFTGIGAGAFACSVLVYAFNRGQYHRLVRSAVLVGAISYTLGGFSVMIDMSRWWNIWKVLVYVWRWNLNSILLEVAVCVVTYMLVLWVEFLPAVTERLENWGPQWVRNSAASVGNGLKVALPWIIPLAMVLPTMHQSSLGSLFMLAPSKEHPLWHTTFLPLLFLLSCLSMGYAALVVVNMLESLVWGTKRDVKMLAKLGVAAGALELAWVAVRLADLGARGRLGLVFSTDRVHATAFLVEVGLFVATAIAVMVPAWRNSPTKLYVIGLGMLLGGALYRLDTYVLAFNPGDHWHYFPSATETLFTVGLGAVGVLVFILFVKIFPVLEPQRRHA